MAVEVFTNDGLGTVTTGGGDAPTAGTQQTWTVTVTNAFPVASTSASPQTQFYIADQATATESEKILVQVNPGGTGAGQTWTVTRGADNSTPVIHAANWQIVQAVTRASLQVLQRPWLVKPSGDTTGATDFTAISGAFAGSGKVELAPGNYWTNQTIQLPGNSAFAGAMPIEFGTSRLLMANGANLDAVIASAGWATNANTLSQAPVQIHDLVIDANNSSQASGAGHCLVSQNWGSYFENIVAMNPRGDWFRLDFFGINGTTGITNTMVENRVHRCKTIGTSTNGGFNFHTTDPVSTSSITDGFLTECLFAGGIATGANSSILINASGGWLVQGNHVYGMNTSGINCQRPLDTRIIGNYIEPFGANAALHTYNGIVCGNCQQQNGAIISLNTIRMSQAAGNAGSTLNAIQFDTANNLTADCVITDNMIYCNNAVATRNGVVVSNNNGAGGASSVTNAVTTGNLLTGTFTNTLQLLPGAGVINHTAGV